MATDAASAVPAGPQQPKLKAPPSPTPELVEERLPWRERFKHWLNTEARCYGVSAMIHSLLFLLAGLCVGAAVHERAKPQPTFEVVAQERVSEPDVQHLQLGDPNGELLEVAPESALELKPSAIEYNDDLPIYEKKGGGSVGPTDNTMGGMGLNLKAMGLGPTAKGLGGLDGGGGFGNKPGRGGDGVGFGGRGSGRSEISFFGIKGAGNKIVYVLDRSKSMSNKYHRPESDTWVVPFDAAREELYRSLNSLTPKHLFHLVYYDNETEIYNGGPSQSDLIPATADHKQKVLDFVAKELRPRGATKHYEALEAAIRMKPDVIFWLTDGEPKDDPKDDQVQRLKQLNEGRKISINCIQFGEKEPEPTSTLIAIPKQNKGKHIFIDVTQAGDYAKKIGEQLRSETGVTKKQP